MSDESERALAAEKKLYDYEIAVGAWIKAMRGWNEYQDTTINWLVAEVSRQAQLIDELMGGNYLST
jgi:hypothetical protein